MEYKITYSNRKTIAIYVHKDTSVEVKCPKKTNKKTITEIISKKEQWINKSITKMLAIKREELSESEKIAFVKKGEEILPKKVEHFSKVMGVKPSGIKIGNAKSYWGCCSGNNQITFSWRLMQASDEVIDYVVVHELAHIKEHNHSKKFWSEVERILPNYRKCIEELKKLG